MNSSSDVRSAATGSHERSQLTTRLEETRRVVARVRTAIVILGATSAFLVLCGGMALADYFAEFPDAVRGVWLAAASLATVIGGGMIWWTWAQGFTLREAARAIETGCRNFGQRFRTFVDYEDSAEATPAAASPGLVKALICETQALVSNQDYERVARTQPLRKTLFALASVLAVWCVWLTAGPEFRIAAGRTFLAPLDYTQVTFTPQETAVLEGGDVSIQVEITGRPLRQGKLRFLPRVKGAQWTEIDIQDLARGSAHVTTVSSRGSGSSAAAAPTSNAARDADATTAANAAAPRERLSGQFEYLLSDCRQSLDFEVRVGPRELPAGSIRVIQPLRVERFSAHVQPPAYTGLPAADVETPQFRVQEGSQVRFEIELNRRTLDYHLVPVGDAPRAQERVQEIEIAIQERVVVGTINDLREPLSFDFHAGSADGMRLEPLRMQIRIQPDGKPTVRFLKPAEELEVIATAEIPLQVEAGDDLGLSKVGIAFQIGDGSMQPLWEQDYTGSRDRVQHQELLPLENHNVHFPGNVNYFAFAEDNYFGEPRRVVTPLRFVDIRPFKRAYQLLDSGGT